MNALNLLISNPQNTLTNIVSLGTIAKDLQSEGTSIENLIDLVSNENVENAIGSTTKDGQSRVRKTLKKIIDFISKYPLRFAFAVANTLAGVGAIVTGNFFLGFLALANGASTFYEIYKNALSSSNSVDRVIQKVQEDIRAIDEINHENQSSIAEVQAKVTSADSNIEAIEDSNKKIITLAQENPATPPAILVEAEKQSEAIAEFKENLQDIKDLTEQVEIGQAEIKNISQEAADDVKKVKAAAEREVVKSIALSSLGTTGGYYLSNGNIKAALAGGALLPFIYKYLLSENSRIPSEDAPVRLTTIQQWAIRKLQKEFTASNKEGGYNITQLMVMMHLKNKFTNLNNEETCNNNVQFFL